MASVVSGRRVMANRPRAVDLFCGCGGFSCGASTHFEGGAGVDLDATALAVYARHHARAIHADLAEVDAVAGLEFDVLIGSPPCQDFSNSGGHHEGERARLTVAFARTVVRHRPRLAVMENVPYLLRSRACDEVCRLWTEAGYNVLALLVNAAACGAAQDRRRAFLIATTAPPELLERTRRDADLDRVPADAATVASCLDDDRVGAVWYCARNRWQPCVYAADRPSPTLRCNCLARRPPGYQRRHDDAAEEAHELSVSEAARVGSFPADYFEGTRRAVAARLLGNAVPPAMAAVVAGLCRALLVPAPAVGARRGVVVGAPRPYAGKPGRIERLRALHPFAYDGRQLTYVMGDDPRADAAVCAVLRWRPRAAWRVVVRARDTVTANADDVYVHVPGHRTEFRSRAQLRRALGEGCC